MKHPFLLDDYRDRNTYYNQNMDNWKTRCGTCRYVKFTEQAIYCQYRDVCGFYGLCVNYLPSRKPVERFCRSDSINPPCNGKYVAFVVIDGNIHSEDWRVVQYENGERIAPGNMRITSWMDMPKQAEGEWYEMG